VHDIGCIILHHFLWIYNLFFIFSVPYKKVSGKIRIWWIFPEIVKII